MRFCGIDLHSNNSVVVVTDEADKVLVSRCCPNDLAKILALLAPHRTELSGIVVEATYNWYWLADGLISPTQKALSKRQKRFPSSLPCADLRSHFWSAALGVAETAMPRITKGSVPFIPYCNPRNNQKE